MPQITICLAQKRTIDRRRQATLQLGFHRPRLGRTKSMLGEYKFQTGNKIHCHLRAVDTTILTIAYYAGQRLPNKSHFGAAQGAQFELEILSAAAAQRRVEPCLRQIGVASQRGHRRHGAVVGEIDGQVVVTENARSRQRAAPIAAQYPAGAPS